MYCAVYIWWSFVDSCSNTACYLRQGHFFLSVFSFWNFPIRICALTKGLELKVCSAIFSDCTASSCGQDAPAKPVVYARVLSTCSHRWRTPCQTTFPFFFLNCCPTEMIERKKDCFLSCLYSIRSLMTLPRTFSSFFFTFSPCYLIEAICINNGAHCRIKSDGLLLTKARRGRTFSGVYSAWFRGDIFFYFSMCMLFIFPHLFTSRISVFKIKKDDICKAAGFMSTNRQEKKRCYLDTTPFLSSRKKLLWHSKDRRVSVL